MGKRVFLLISILSVLNSYATVWVYPGASSSMMSAVYQVTVTQGSRTDTSFVYQDANQYTEKKNQMTDFNHWTTFSFSGTITVNVKKLTGNIDNCTIYPINDSITGTITDSELSFELSQPRKIFLEMQGEYENPLFIFADAPETNIPDKNNPNVVWYGPGVHSIGKNQPLQSNKTYYFEGGSYVKGSFVGSNISNTQFIGRGILSGIDIPHCGHSECEFAGVAIHLNNGGTNQLIEGITITNSSSYCILSRGQITCRNTKCFGWWYETDGFGAGDNSLLEDAFFKVNDDCVKLYPKNMIVRNLVIYQQMNGAPFQFAWSGQSGQNGVVSDIDLINCDISGTSLWTSNKPLINMRNGVNNAVSNFTFTDIRADKDVAQLIGINTTGSCSNLTLKNIKIRGKQKGSSYLRGNISGIKIENVEIYSSCISSNGGINLQTQGNVSPVSYFCSVNGVQENKIENAFQIKYDNTLNLISISSNKNDQFNVEIYNSTGLKRIERRNQKWSSTIETSTISNGVYIVIVKNAVDATAKKIIVNK